MERSEFEASKKYKTFRFVWLAIAVAVVIVIVGKLAIFVSRVYLLMDIKQREKS